MAYLYKYEDLLCHVTHTRKHRSTLHVSQHPKGTAALFRKLGLAVAQQSPLRLLGLIWVGLFRPFSQVIA